MQQLQHSLGDLVGLCHHGGAGLLQDLGARQSGGFGGEVGILDAAAGRRQVFGRDLQVGNRCLETRLESAELGAFGSDNKAAFERLMSQ